MEIRRAGVDDAEKIATVHVESWRATYRGIVPQAYLDGLAVADRAAGWRRSLALPTAVTFVAEVDGRLVGFASVEPSRDVDADAQATGEVTSIYLMPDARGRGTGRRLMRAARSELARAGFLTATLWVLERNTPALRFYDREGWWPEGRRRSLTISGRELSEIRLARSLDDSDAERHHRT